MTPTFEVLSAVHIEHVQPRNCGKVRFVIKLCTSLTYAEL